MDNLYLLLNRKCIAINRLALKYLGLTLLLFFTTCLVQAQLSLTNGLPSAAINFSTTIAGVNNGTFNASGFSPTPGVGQLNSNAWAMTGWSDGDLAFGGTRTTANTDYTRGNTPFGMPITTGGVYSVTGGPGTPTFMVQPGGSDFTPGTLTLRIQNNGTSLFNQLAVSYNLYIRNDQARGNSFNFSYSTDNVTYTAVSGLDYTSPMALDGLGWVAVPGAPSRSTIITGITVVPGAYFYIRWTGDDVNGSGSRDEFGLDDINLTATFPGPCTPPTTNATITSFSNIFSSQVDVNFTRGNGTGGLLIVASAAPLSQNAVNGANYTANFVYGAGSAIGNGFVVYNSNAVAPLTAGSFTMTGLNPNTLYYLNAFEYAVTVPCYVTSPNTNTVTTALTSGTSPSDDFRSRISGNWSNATTWQSFTGGFWITADIAPTAASASILVQAGHTVDIASTVGMDQVTISGTLALLNSGKINLADGTGFDIDITSGGILQISSNTIYTTTFNITAGATLNVATGGKITIGNGASSPGYSPLGNQVGLVTWNHGAIYEWNTTDPFVTSAVTYFPGAASGVIPIFRITKSPSLTPGALSATTWNGLMEVNSNVTMRFAGTRTIRNGITGTANLTIDDTGGQLIINGATAQLGGTGTINLNGTITPNMVIDVASVTTMTSSKNIQQIAGTGLTVNGTLYCDAFNITGSANFTLAAAATIRLGSALGITSAGATGNIQTTGARSFSTTANYIYNGTTNQVTGNGLPTAVNSLTIINTGIALDNTVTLTTTNTTTPLLTLTSGLFASGTTQQLNISNAGSVVVTSGNFATGATAGIINFAGTGTFSGSSAPYDVYASGAVNFGVGTVTIQNGGSFRINAGGSAISNAAFYADGSTLVYNSGGVYTASVEWVTTFSGMLRGVPSNVTLLASSTSVSFGASGSIRNMRGNLLINNGTTFSLSTAAGGDLNIGGNWTRNATGAFNHNGRMVTFNGTLSNQTITVTGGGTETFGYFQLAKTAVGFPELILAASPNATNININGSATSNVASFTLLFNGGNIDLNQNTLNFNAYNGVGGNLNNIQLLNLNTTRFINSTGGQGTFAVYNNFGSGNPQVLIERLSNGGSNLRRLDFSSNVRITIGAAAGGFCGLSFGFLAGANYQITKINGILQINTGGYVHTYAPEYGTNSTLVYNTGGAFDRNVEWGAIIQPGYPFHVIVQNNTNLTLNFPNTNGDADRALAGNLTVQNGSGLLLATTAANRLTVGGSLVLNGSLTLPTVIGGDLYVASDWTRSATGVFTPNDRAVYFNGTGNSNLTANNGELFPYIYITKSVVGNTLFLNNDMSVIKELGISTGTLDLINSNTILKSDVNATASLGKFTANGAVTYTGTGRFIVERFIATNAAPTSNPYHNKSWQLLAIPVDSIGTMQTINQAWQEGNAPLVAGTAGLGTIISNNTAGTGGFDIVGGSGPSMKTFVPSSSTWAGISGTNIRHYNQKGYMILVRGDRTITTSSALSNPTTLRTRGRIFNPANVPPTTNVGVTQFESIGNPYPSAIDFSNEAGVVKSVNMQRVFYVWDPRLGGAYGLGGYQTFTKVANPGTDYLVSPGGFSYGASGTVHNLIESGQAFLVHSFGGSGTISFNENAKVSGSRLVHRIISPNAQQESSLRTNLYNTSGSKAVLVDGVVHDFSRNYSNGLDIMDALKMRNTSENLGIRCGTEILAVERRGLIQKLDTLRFDLTQTRVATYTFEFYPKNLSGNSLRAYLVDNYLQTKTAISLSDTSLVNFSIENIPGSYAADRFILIFLNGRGPVFTQLNAENAGKDILVKWTVPAGQSGTYDVERSANGLNFETLQEGITAGSTSNNWRDSDPLPGMNYYRIHHLSASADMGYSNKVRLSTQSTEEKIAVYPNPVVNGRMGLRFHNAEKGRYQLRLMGMEGKSISNFSLFHNANIEKKSFQLPADIPAGIYSLEITAPSGAKQTLHVVVTLR